MQEEIAALGAGLVEAQKYLVCWLEHSNEQMFGDPIMKLVKKGRKTNMNINEESKHMVYVYVDGWQSRLKALSEIVTDSCFATISIPMATPDIPSAPTSKVLARNASYVIAGDECQLNAEPDFTKAGPEPKCT